MTGWGTNSQYPGNADDPPISPLASTVAGRDTSIELIPYGCARLRVTEFPWINSPVEVMKRVQNVNNLEFSVTTAKKEKCLFTYTAAGRFDFSLRDIAGRTVYHLSAQGPKSFTVESTVLRNGIYVAHLVSSSGKFEKKMVIVK